jgi:hypothetical protein
MSEQRSGAGSRRARPVAELTLEPLLERVPELARRWASALILDSPMESLGAVPLEDLAREAPSLAGALLGALRSDGELDGLLGGGRTGRSPAERISAMSGAAEPAAVVAAVEALRGVLSDALMDEFGMTAPDPARARQLTDLADRLAYVCAAILPLAMAGIEPLGEPSVTLPGATSPAARTVIAAGSRPAPPGAVIIDERALAEPQAPGSADLRAEAGDVGEASPSAEIQIRDERGDEGPSAWIRSIGRQLERHDADGISFAVLLVELRRDGGRPAEVAWEPIEELLTEELRASGAGTMTREREGRYWLLVPGIDRLGAAGLAGQLTRSLESVVVGRRLGLSVAVGTAVCPDDGRGASALAAHADVGLYAARSERHLAAPAEGRAGS